MKNKNISKKQYFLFDIYLEIKSERNSYQCLIKRWHQLVQASLILHLIKFCTLIFV